MIINTTRPDKKTTRLLYETVGLEYSFLERIKMKGIGSRSLVIQSIASEYENFLKPEHYQTKVNIELRKKGLIIHIRYKLDNYSWLMPYKEVEIKQDQTLQLVCQGKQISFLQDDQNQTFVNKLLQLINSVKQ